MLKLTGALVAALTMAAVTTAPARSAVSPIVGVIVASALIGGVVVVTNNDNDDDDNAVSNG